MKMKMVVKHAAKCTDDYQINIILQIKSYCMVIDERKKRELSLYICEPEKSSHFGEFIAPRLLHGFQSFKF